MSNKKDPAFLFYAKDFYEGTRTLLPEERACFIDLLIYQHQHGFIPNNIKKLTLYCSGISEDALRNVLDEKFTLCERGYVNVKLQDVTDERKAFATRQKINGTIGNFWKILKKETPVDYQRLRKLLSKYSNEDLYKILQEKHKGSLDAMRNAMRTHLEDENADAIEDVNSSLKTPLEKLKSNVAQFELLQKQFAHLNEIEKFLESCSIRIQTNDQTQKWESWAYKTLIAYFRRYLSSVYENLQKKQGNRRTDLMSINDKINEIDTWEI